MLIMTPQEAMKDALAKHPDCKYADWDIGLDGRLNLTIVVSLWRSEECWVNNDPPKYVIQDYRTTLGCLDA